MSALTELRALMQMQEFEKAVQHLEKMLIVEPENPLLWNIRGDIIQLVDSLDGPPLSEAERSYLKALELSPYNLEAIESLAHYYDAVAANPVEAKKYAKEYLRISQKASVAMSEIVMSD
jgi:tetratricopeptide (TPR) repeat protein